MGKSSGLISGRDCWALRLESNPENFNYYTELPGMLMQKFAYIDYMTNREQLSS